MSRKQELQTKLMELQAGYSEVSKELKEILEEERCAKQREKYKDYLYKVGHYGRLYEEESIKEVTDSDREEAQAGFAGLPVTNVDKREGLGYIMMRSKEEYARLSLLFKRINAVEALKDKDSDADKCIKAILGEE